MNARTTIEDFKKLLKEGVFKKGIMEHVDYHGIETGYVVTVFYPLFNERIRLTGFIGDKAENQKERCTVQYERSTNRKAYIAMGEVSHLTVEKKAKEKKVVSAAQQKLKLAQQAQRQFRM